MKTKVISICAAVTALTAGIASGQNFQRRANITGGGSPDRGKCTIEVVVDGAAEVEIRGENAVLRNLAGQPPEWRRFVCTSPMPVNPPGFRFTGVDGRGSQELVRAPYNGGPAVIRIQDPDGGREGYTFDVTWGGEPIIPVPDRDRGRGPGPGRGPDRRFTTDEAVRACQDSVRRQAWDRFRANNIAFRRTALDDNPGRRDWVTGLIDIRRGYNRDETYRFSCSVNFDTGEIRNVEINRLDEGYGPGRGRGPGDRPDPARIAINSCQNAVEDRLGRDGYQHVDFLNINVDDRPGRNDWIVGVARADIRMRSDTYNFSCNVDLRDGDVRSVEVRRR